MKAASVLETIGRTPHIRFSRLFPQHEVWVKAERFNPGGSIKDRIALSMIEAAEKSGQLKPGATIIEPTSGNTGVGLAMVAAVKGYKLILVMPESMSVERRRLMLAYGATFDLTPKEKGMKGAIARAEELAAQTPNAWIPQQFENPANVAAHEATTAQEILADFPEGLDAIITGVGTGGHISGVAKVLKAKWPQSLADLADVMASELKREGVAEPGVKSRKLALVLAHYLGGRAYYIPTGEKLKAALRDLEIFERWYQNEPMDSIATHYKLSHPQLYVIIAEQRKLHRKRHQPDMFDS